MKTRQGKKRKPAERAGERGPMDHQFRNTAFGFHKKDVLDYLELVAQQHGQQMQSLQERLDQAVQELDGLSRREGEQSAQLERARTELERQQERSGRLEEQLREAQARAEQLEQELLQAREEGRRFREEAERLRPGAEAYDAVKERAAGMELQAHQRAQAVLDDAQEEVRQIRGRVEQWVARAAAQYAGLRRQVESAAAQAAQELQKAQGCLDQVVEGMARQDEALEELQRTCTEGQAAKVPAPMPLSEE